MLCFANYRFKPKPTITCSEAHDANCICFSVCLLSVIDLSKCLQFMSSYDNQLKTALVISQYKKVYSGGLLQAEASQTMFT